MPSSKTKRTLWEILIVVLLVVACYGVYALQEHRLENAREEHSKELSSRIEATEEQTVTAIFHAFTSGLRPIVLAESLENVDAAVGELIRYKPITFAHVLAPDGIILATTDRKFAALGRVDARGDWVLAATSQKIRRGEDVLEIAGPIAGPTPGDRRRGGAVAYVWIGYRPDLRGEGRHGNVEPTTP